MGYRSIFKYLMIFQIATTLMGEGMRWVRNAKDEDSPGGEEITPEELLELMPIIEKAVMQGLGIDVKLIPKM